MTLWLQIGLVTVFLLAIIAVFTAAVRSGRPGRRLLRSGTQGLGAVVLLNVTAGVTGVSLGFSWLTVGSALLLGLPGVIGLVLMQIILPFV